MRINPFDRRACSGYNIYEGAAFMLTSFPQGFQWNKSSYKHQMRAKEDESFKLLGALLSELRN